MLGQSVQLIVVILECHRRRALYPKVVHVRFKVLNYTWSDEFQWQAQQSWKRSTHVQY